MLDFTQTYFYPKFHNENFLKTDIICVNHFGTDCGKKFLDNCACLLAI